MDGMFGRKEVRKKRSNKDIVEDQIVYEEDWE